MSDKFERRRNMTVRIVPLASREAGEQPTSPESATERLALVRELSERMWRLSGRPLPSYTRATMPIRVSRLEEQGNED